MNSLANKNYYGSGASYLYPAGLSFPKTPRLGCFSFLARCCSCEFISQYIELLRSLLLKGK